MKSIMSLKMSIFMGKAFAQYKERNNYRDGELRDQGNPLGSL